MNRITAFVRWLTLATVILALSGCSQNEHKETKITQEQKEGPVEDTSPGEMIVE